MIGVEAALVGSPHAWLQPACADRTAACAGLRAKGHYHCGAVGLRTLKLPRS